MNDRQFWAEVRRGLLLVVRAIEYRWGLPRGSATTLGAALPGEAPLSNEPPLTTPARSSQEGVESNGL